MAKVFSLTTDAHIARVYLHRLRSVELQQNKANFRKSIRRIGFMLGAELSKTLTYTSCTVRTPLADAQSWQLVDRVVLVPILRAGLALYDGLLDMFDEADSIFIGSYRKEGAEKKIGSGLCSHQDVAVDYLSYTKLDGGVCVLCDPMLATGSSLVACMSAMFARNKAKYSALHVVCVVATQQGIDTVRQVYPDAHIWCAAIDPQLNDKNYIVPGLGDAGDLCYGVRE